MSKKTLLIICFTLISSITIGQNNSFIKLDFIIGKWTGTGSGFGNGKSKISSSFSFIMSQKYIEVQNEAQFEPTENKPKGDYHIDKGFISFDTGRKAIVFRQFNNEGFINQYVLNEELSTNELLVFETETIESFVPGGKARWTIKKISENEIETIFDVYFPNKGFSCFGTNKLKKIK